MCVAVPSAPHTPLWRPALPGTRLSAFREDSGPSGLAGLFLPTDLVCREGSPVRSGKDVMGGK